MGINHFNSNTDVSDWVFAAQAKTGIRFHISECWRLFAEYRYLYLASSSYTFGAMQYPTHVPTTKWNVTFGNIAYNMGTLGVEYLI